MALMTKLRLGSILGATLIVVSPAVPLPGPTGALSPSNVVAVAAEVGLPLGPAGLAEDRTTTTLQPGVTLTTIVRGAVDPSQFWTVEVLIPAGTSSPDPDAPPASLSDRASADVLADRTRPAGFDPRVELVTTPATADYSGGSLGWRVRVGHLATRVEADALRAQLVAAGFGGSTRFTGWDGVATARGPWRIRLLSIDPDRFRGSLVASYGPDLEARETTSALSLATGATAAVNGGYFVLDPASGAPGDPAGVGVYDGKLLSETVDRRPALVLRDNARRTQVERLTWSGSARSQHGVQLQLDGIDRVPGLVRNCGGTADDLPTAEALHDFTCTDPDELVAFTSDYARNTPTGPGLEAVLDRRDRVVSLRSPRGGPLLQGYRTIQATGALVAQLERAAVPGERLRISTGLRAAGRPVLQRGAVSSVVNGGPELVRNGRVHVTPRTDGFVRPTNPSFYYGFSDSRNPRTFAGVDARGRTLLATADGRSTESLGLSIPETGAVAQALGMRNALNLDGGGSTTMVVRGQVVNLPSDATGERPVGDALLVVPRRR